MAALNTGGAVPTIGAELRSCSGNVPSMRYAPPTLLALLVPLTLCANIFANTAVAQTCYMRPLPRVGDIWHCTSSCGRTTPHAGVDFPAATGTAVPAIADGVAIRVPYSSCIGNVLVIRHPDGLYSGYSHLSAILVADGQSVLRGQTVAQVGATGTCQTGPHLHLTLGDHLESYYDRATIDPLAYIDGHAAGVNCEQGAGSLDYQQATYAAPSSTDVNGDGRSDLCARAADGFHCWPAQDDGWGESWTPIPWTDAATWNELNHYATIRMGDVNGDGLADACIRSNDAFHCALSNGEGFEEMTIWRDGISDAAGWSNPQYCQTIRLADVNGDGRDDLCARHSTAFSCWLSDGAQFADQIDGPGWSDAVGFAVPHYYGTLRMGDINGDGMSDVCIRGAAGMGCALSDGAGFPTAITGPAWADAQGFTAAPYWTTIRMADVNGDGLDDLCVRTSDDYRCHFSTGTGFEPGATVVAVLSNASGWDDPTNYESLRFADVNGDGAEDLCGRANAGLVCWAYDGDSFAQIVGPEWSDALGWGASAQYYDTIRLGDHDGDGVADACARSGAGFICYLSSGTEFPTLRESGLLADAQGWSGSASFWSTIYMAGTCNPRPEICNGRDDDCDGQIDDGTCIDAAMLDAGVVGRDASDPFVDGGRTDAGRGPTISGNCGCRAGAGTRPPMAALVLLGLALTLPRRR